MPLPRLSDKKSRDGMVSSGAMSQWIKVDNPALELWAHLSTVARRGEFTAHYVPGICAGATVSCQSQQFRVSRVIELGRQKQMKLLCTQI